MQSIDFEIEIQFIEYAIILQTKISQYLEKYFGIVSYIHFFDQPNSLLQRNKPHQFYSIHICHFIRNQTDFFQYFERVGWEFDVEKIVKVDSIY